MLIRNILTLPVKLASFHLYTQNAHRAIPNVIGLSLNTLNEEKPAEESPLIVIRRDWCKGCGICAAFCPKKVLELDENEKAAVVRQEQCTQCGLCERHCPDMAIEVIH
jgi:NAD-dependent dihydropyrimidine dehydrogenase PreA subunit